MAIVGLIVVAGGCASDDPEAGDVQAGIGSPTSTGGVEPSTTEATDEDVDVDDDVDDDATSSTTTPPPVRQVPDVTAPADAAGVTSLLDQLVVAPEHSRDGYDRDLFDHWIGQGQGCDTRDRVLIDEAVTPPAVGGGCSLSGGSWFSAYDGVSVAAAGDLDIDHVVALAEAWDSGAWAWDAQRREEYANDLGDERSLIAVTAATNRSKGDQDPAEWVPPLASYGCTYATDWVAVKVRWSLTADADEIDALRTLLEGCES